MLSTMNDILTRIFMLLTHYICRIYNIMTFSFENGAGGTHYFSCCRLLLFQNTIMKQFNKADAFYSNLCFICFSTE